MVIILLCIKKNSKPVDCFWIFVDPSSYDNVALADFIKVTLHEVTGQNKEKLISQNYNGENIMRGRYSRVQTKIKEEYVQNRRC